MYENIAQGIKRTFDNLIGYLSIGVALRKVNYLHFFLKLGVIVENLIL